MNEEGHGLPRPTDRVEQLLRWVLAAGMALLFGWAGSAGVAGYTAELAQRPEPATAGPVAVGSDASRPVDPAVIGGVSAVGVGAGIWVDQDGRPAPPPDGSSQALLAGAADAGSLLISGGAVLFGLWWAARRVLIKRNLRRWEREWTRYGPQWSRGPR